jgi:tRNA(fMet)-specific endonuclease VapC
VIILDTDHISILQDNQAKEHATLLANMSASTYQDFAVTVVTLEEQIRGWLAYLNRSPDVSNHVTPYDRLIGIVQFFSQWAVLRFDKNCADQFKQLRGQKVRIGTMDLKIAAIALVEMGYFCRRICVTFSRCLAFKWKIGCVEECPRIKVGVARGPQRR